MPHIQLLKMKTQKDKYHCTTSTNQAFSPHTSKKKLSTFIHSGCSICINYSIFGTASYHHIYISHHKHSSLPSTIKIPLVIPGDFSSPFPLFPLIYLCLAISILIHVLSSIPFIYSPFTHNSFLITTLSHASFHKLHI